MGSILHSTKSPNLSFQRIYEQGYKPRRLFVHNQGGQSTGQDAPVLVGPGDSPHECMQNVQAAKAMAKAITAIRESQEASANSSMPRLQVDRLFQSAAMAVEQVEQARDRGDDLQGSPQAGGSSSGSRMSAEQVKGKGKTKAPMEAIQAYLEEKGKGKGGKGKNRPHEDEEEPAGELSEESPRTLDPVIEGAPEDEDDSGGADGAGAEETAASSTADEGRDATAASSAAPATAEGGHGEEGEAAADASSPPRCLRSPRSRAYGEAVWAGRISWGEPLPADMVPDREEQEDAVWPSDDEDGEGGEAGGAEGVSRRSLGEDYEAEERPPRQVAKEAEHEMIPMDRNRFVRVPPQQLGPDQMRFALQTLMGGAGLGLQWGPYVQWNWSTVVLGHPRYGMFGGLAVEFDHGNNMIVLQRAFHAGVSTSLPLQPKQMPVVGPRL